MSVHQIYHGDQISICQYKYPPPLYKREIHSHQQTIFEYGPEIEAFLSENQQKFRPNMKLYAHQPYTNAVVRHKLVDFTLKMSDRLKIVPFVFCRAVRLFDRYCSKRVVLLDQAQLLITTCLWIAAKVHGGNNHFANMGPERKNHNVGTISDLGYGSGGRFFGPTERYRLPRLRELAQLCGTKCNYDPHMFVQMELHVMTALEWGLNDPSFDDFLVTSSELKLSPDGAHDEKLAEIHRTKSFMAYAACYSYDLVQYDPSQISRVIVDLVNSTFSFSEHDSRFQTLNFAVELDSRSYVQIRHNLVRAVASAPPFLLQKFGSVGPQSMYTFLAGARYNSPFRRCEMDGMEFRDAHKLQIYQGSPERSINQDHRLVQVHDNSQSIQRHHEKTQRDIQDTQTLQTQTLQVQTLQAENLRTQTFQAQTFQSKENHKEEQKNHHRSHQKYHRETHREILKGRNIQVNPELHPQKGPALTLSYVPSHGYSHHYPPLYPPQCAFRTQRTNSSSSVRSEISPKEDIFDSVRPGIPTPSSDDDCKIERF